MTVPERRASVVGPVWLLVCVAAASLAAVAGDTSGWGWSGSSPSAPALMRRGDGLFYSAEFLRTDSTQFSLSAPAIGRQTVVIEGSLRFAMDDPKHGEAKRIYDTPVLLRLGLIDDVELRIGADGASWMQLLRAQDSHFGFSDFSAGVKWQITQAAGWTPCISLTPYLTAPTGNDEFSVQRVNYGVILALDWELPGHITLGLNGGLAQASEEYNPNLAESDRIYRRSTYWQYRFSGMLTYRITPNFAIFGEFVRWPPARQSTNTMYAGGGMKFLVSPDVLIHIGAYGGLGQRARDFLARVGVGWRIGPESSLR